MPAAALAPATSLAAADQAHPHPLRGVLECVGCWLAAVAAAVLAAIAAGGLWAGRATATRLGMAGAAAAIDNASRPRKGQPQLPAVVTANASSWTQPRCHSVNAVPNQRRLKVRQVI